MRETNCNMFASAYVNEWIFNLVQRNAHLRWEMFIMHALFWTMKNNVWYCCNLKTEAYFGDTVQEQPISNWKDLAMDVFSSFLLYALFYLDGYVCKIARCTIAILSFFSIFS